MAIAVIKNTNKVSPALAGDVGGRWVRYKNESWGKVWLPLRRPFPNVSVPRLHKCFRIFSVEAQRLEDNGVSSSSFKTPGTWEVEELLLKWFVPKTFTSGRCGVSGSCLQEVLAAKLHLKRMHQGPVCSVQNPTALCAENKLQLEV